MSDVGFPKQNNQTMSGFAVYTGHDGSHFEHWNSATFPQRYEDKVSVRTPGWPAVIRENDYFHIRFFRRDSLTHYVTVFDNGDVDEGDIPPWTLSGGWTGGDDPEIREATNNLRDRLINKMAAQVQGQRVNLGVAFGERKQTADLVASTINRIVGSVRALKNRNFAGAARELGIRTDLSSLSRRHRGLSVPEAWLELQYGWKPLLSDVYGSCEELLSREKERPPVIHVKVSAKEQLSQKLSLGPFETAWPVVRLSKTGNVQGSARVRFAVNNELIQLQSRTGISNPLAVAWELVPWSFVVDWFLPVGQFLGNLGYGAGLTCLGGSFSFRSKTKWTGGPESSTKRGSSYTQSHSGGSIDEEFNGFSREAFSSWPPVPLPHFKDPLSLGHVANALSLLATTFASASPKRFR
jgi:hypothetical protein